MSGTAYVRVDGVGKTFGDVTALDGVTLDVPAGMGTRMARGARASAARGVGL